MVALGAHDSFGYALDHQKSHSRGSYDCESLGETVKSVSWTQSIGAGDGEGDTSDGLFDTSSNSEDELVASIMTGMDDEINKITSATQFEARRACNSWVLPTGTRI